MNYATNFALVGDGVVTNIAWGMLDNMDEFPGAVQVDDRAVGIGDRYEDGAFYRGGAPVKTRAELMAELETARDALQADLMAIRDRLTALNAVWALLPEDIRTVIAKYTDREPA